MFEADLVQVNLAMETATPQIIEYLDSLSTPPGLEPSQIVQKSMQDF